MNDAAFCEAMLPRVSRTFALCIRLLPADLEYPILIAYLLCRIADTIEDTADLPPSTKGELLREFANWMADPGRGPGALPNTFARRATDEELLAHHAEAVMREFLRLTDPQQACITPWVQEMARGMAEFAERQDQQGAMTALASVDELDRYCYFVAGTVGHMLTALYQTGGRSFAPEHAARLKDLATSFGLGLQLTNIIKDVSDDRARGWSFVPLDLCTAQGIRPEDMLAPEHAPAARAVMDALISKAEGHLTDARVYTQNIPRGEYRIRLFCLTSMFFAVRTLSLARRGHQHLDGQRKLKISRRAVYTTLLGSVLVAPSNALIDYYYRQLATT